MVYNMIKEIILEEGTHDFIFVGIEPYNYLDRVLNIFESNFSFTSKKHISGWHSTIIEYIVQDITITIGDAYDVLSITLINPITDNSIEKVKSWVQNIDESLKQKTEGEADK